MKFRISVEEELYYPSSENKGADQLRGYREADLRLCFRLGKNPVFSRCGSIIVTICYTDCCSFHIHAQILHYENLSMQNTEYFSFSAVKIENIFAQNIVCWSTLELPRQDGSNEYPIFMFWMKNKKVNVTPAYHSLNGTPASFLFKSTNIANQTTLYR